MYYFMDEETYEQVPLTVDQLGVAKKFLKAEYNFISEEEALKSYERLQAVPQKPIPASRYPKSS